MALLLVAAACDDDVDEVDTAEAPDESATDDGATDDGATDDAASGTDEAEVDDVDEAEIEEMIEDSAAGGLGIPEDFPDAFPLPDDHMVVRMNVGSYEPVGLSIAANIAVDGDVDEVAEFYDDALRSGFEDVEVLEDVEDTPWRFSGHGFEFGRLYVSSNFGMTDPEGNDSSHLPVMLTIFLEEQLDD